VNRYRQVGISIDCHEQSIKPAGCSILVNSSRIGDAEATAALVKVLLDRML